MPNTNMASGLPYGVVAGNSLDPEVAQELWMKAQGLECAEYEKERRSDITRLIQDDFDYHGWRDDYVDEKLSEIIEYLVEKDTEDFQCEAPCATFMYEGTTVAVSYLGGAMLVTSVDGPRLQVRSMCSPCVPGAADIDSGYGDIVCHGFPMTWFTEEAWARLTDRDED